MLSSCIKLNERQMKVLLVVACATFLIFLLSFLEPGYAHICENADNPHPANCPSYNVVAFFFSRFIGLTNQYGPAITAFATIAIGFFTLTLWRSTDRAGEHYKSTERAYIQMSHHGGLEFMAGSIPTLRMQIRNRGNTPARVIRSAQRCDIWDVRKPLPADPEYNFGENSQTPPSRCWGSPGATFMVLMCGAAIGVVCRLKAICWTYLSNGNPPK